MRRSLMVGACALAVLTLAVAPGVAQDTQTITAVGDAQVAVKPTNRTSNACVFPYSRRVRHRRRR